MDIHELYTATNQGPRPEMQDAVMASVAGDGTYFLGVFDGHGPAGGFVAKRAKKVIERLAEFDFPPHHDIFNRANRVRTAFRAINHEMRSLGIEGGSTATVAIVAESKVAIVHLGDSEAVLFPDQQPGTVLNQPHDATNSDEVQRVEEEGYGLHWVAPRVAYFGGRIAVSRAIGDGDLPFVLADAEVNVRAVNQPATLVIATDGVWGASDFVRYQVESDITSGAIFDGSSTAAAFLTDKYADVTQDNAAAVVARIY